MPAVFFEGGRERERLGGFATLAHRDKVIEPMLLFREPQIRRIPKPR